MSHDTDVDIVRRSCFRAKTDLRKRGGNENRSRNRKTCTIEHTTDNIRGFKSKIRRLVFVGLFWG